MNRVLKVLVACEESQTVCKEFRELGHEAYSNDIIEPSGGHPEWHLQMDAPEAIKLKDWGLLIAHPPCTYLSRVGARWLFGKDRTKKQKEERFAKGCAAACFFDSLLRADIPHIAVENPTPMNWIRPMLMSYKESQVIQPYQFGHPFSKRTLLWLKNLPLIEATEIVDDYKPFLPSNTGGRARGQKFRYKSISQKESSKTFEGIAKAMAVQWSEYIINQEQ